MKEEVIQKLIPNESESEEDEDIQSDVYEKSSVSCMGISLIILSAFFYSISSLIVKLMLSIDPLQLLLFRYVGLFVFTLPITVYKKVRLFPDNRKEHGALLLHSVVGVFGGAASLYAFRHMPLGDASALCFSTPLFVLILSVILIQEKCSFFIWFLVGLTFSGVVLISKPESLFGVSTDRPVELFGVVSALSAAFFKANSFISLNFCRGLHNSVVICHFGLVGLLFSTAYFIITRNFCVPSNFFDRSILIGMALLGFFGQLFLTVASKTEKPATISICRSTDILFAFIYQILIFHHIPDFFRVVGAFLIIVSVFLIKVKPSIKV